MALDTVAMLAEANASWHGQFTQSQPQWKLKQIHGTYRFLMDNREDIISILSRGIFSCFHRVIIMHTLIRVEDNVSSEVYERQFAFLIKDIATHIQNVSSPATPQSNATLLGATRTSLKPVGVSLILTNSSNPLRFAIAPFVASLAAGNVVILALLEKAGSAFSRLLTDKLPHYVDRTAVFVTSQINMDQIQLQSIHHLLIIGKLTV